MEPLVVRNSITIQAPADKVWAILTNPEQTKKYMFGCETVSDWKPGSPLLWKGVMNGKEMVFVKGFIEEIRQGSYLSYSTFDPNNPALEDIPENYLSVTYTLEEMHGKTRLTVTQGDFSRVADGEKRFADVYNNGEGWNPLLVTIKKIAEDS